MDAWVYIDPAIDFSAGNSYLLVESINNAGVKTSIARSLNLDANRKGQWILIQSTPYGNSGKVPSDAAQLAVSFQHNARGTVTLDNFSLGITASYAHPSEYVLANNSFESSVTSLTSWATYGTVPFIRETAITANKAPNSSTRQDRAPPYGRSFHWVRAQELRSMEAKWRRGSDVNLSSGYLFVEWNRTTQAPASRP